MSKKHAEEIARQYIQTHQDQINGASPRAIETAIKRVAGALTGLKSRPGANLMPNASAETIKTETHN